METAEEMDKRLMMDWRRLERLPKSPNQRLIYMALCVLTLSDGRWDGTMDELALRHALSTRQVQRNVRMLESAGAITVHRGNGRGQPSTFIVHRKAHAPKRELQGTGAEGETFKSE